MPMKIITLEEKRVFDPQSRWTQLVYEWDDELSTATPFWVTVYQSKQMGIDPDLAPFPCQRIWIDHNRLAVVAVRTDEYPLMWIWWWVWIRIEESVRLLSMCLLALLGIWNLSKIRYGAYATWGDVWKQWTKAGQ